MKVRKMKPSDYEKVYALWLNTPNMGLNTVDDSKSGIKKFLKRNPHTCFVAKKGDEIAGVILSGHDGRRGFIYHAAVAESEQRKGVGTALVTAAISALQAEGIIKVGLLAFTDNEAGITFWEKHGFTSRDDVVFRSKPINGKKKIEIIKGEMPNEA